MAEDRDGPVNDRSSRRERRPTNNAEAAAVLQRLFEGDPDTAARPGSDVRGSGGRRSNGRADDRPTGSSTSSGSSNGNGSARDRQPSVRDLAVHDAVMAGFDAMAGGATTGRSGSTVSSQASASAARTAPGSVALALQQSDEEEQTDLARSHRGADLAAALHGSDQEELAGGHHGATVADGARTVLRTGGGRVDHEEGLRGDEDDEDQDSALAGLSGRKTRFNPVTALQHSVGRGVVEAGEMTWLAGSVLKSAITRPTGYWHETKEQIYTALKLCWVPMVISITAFGIGAPGLQGGNVFAIFGVPEREGSFIVATGIREFAPWIDAMIVAGVVGTAITADIGARRIREEIDAMEVLGVDPIRELVLPRILSTAIITGLFDIVALLGGLVGGYIASVTLLGASTAGYTGQFYSQANVADLIGSFVKTFLFGAVVGIVCCYKGLRASGGASGVGRAVNQAVVVSFALIWMINYVFTNILLGFAPSTQVFH